MDTAMDPLALRSEARAAMQSGQKVNGKTFAEWVGYEKSHLSPLTDRLQELAEKFDSHCKQTELDYISIHKGVETPGFNAKVMRIAPPSAFSNPENIAKALDAFFLLKPNQLAPTEIIDEILSVLESIDRHMGYDLMFEKEWMVEWFQGKPYTHGAISITSFTEKWLTEVVEANSRFSPYFSKICTWADVLSSTLPSADAMLSLGWKGLVLYSNERGCMIPIARIASTLWMIRMLKNAIDTTGWRENKKPDPITYAWWKAIMSLPTPVSQQTSEADKASSTATNNVLVPGTWITHLVWINSANRAKKSIEKGLDGYWNEILAGWNLKPGLGQKLSNYASWFNVGDNVYLVRSFAKEGAPSLASYLRTNEHIKKDDNLLVVEVSSIGGLADGLVLASDRNALQSWLEQAKKYAVQPI